MKYAKHEDVFRLFPGLDDHAVAEILAMRATVDELEAALVLLSSDDEELIEIQRREGSQIHRLVNILSMAGVEALEDRD